MTKHPIRHLTDHSVQCLTCACSNIENKSARDLLQITDSMSSAGVLAAVFLADSSEHEQIVGAARDAIHEQRTWCRERGPFRRSHCNWNAPHKIDSK
jgi:hypothetical protein